MFTEDEAPTARRAFSLEKAQRSLEMPPRSQFPTAPVLDDVTVVPMEPQPVIVIASSEPFEVACAMCGTVNWGCLQYCEACGVTLVAAPPPSSLSAVAVPVAEPEVVDDPVPMRVETPMTSFTDLRPTSEAAPIESADVPPVVSRPKGRWIAGTLAVVGPLASAAVLLFLLRATVTPAPTANTAPPPAAATAPVPGPTEAPGAARPDIPTGMGLLKTAEVQPGHRIFVDGRTVGQTPRPVLVKCGAARVKIGSAGHARTLEVPCGQEINLGARE
jgi:hypothetical protein